MSVRYRRPLLIHNLKVCIWNWLRFRSEVKALRAFLSRPIDDDNLEDKRECLAAHYISSALRRRADGLAITKRRLHGLYSAEAHERYWDLMPDGKEHLARVEQDHGTMTVEKLEYFRRFSCFERYEKYLIFTDRAELAGGLPLACETTIDAMQIVLATPRRFTFITENRKLTGRIFDASETPYKQGYVNGVLMRIEYDNNCLAKTA